MQSICIEAAGESPNKLNSYEECIKVETRFIGSGASWMTFYDSCVFEYYIWLNKNGIVKQEITHKTYNYYGSDTCFVQQSIEKVELNLFNENNQAVLEPGNFR